METEKQFIWLLYNISHSLNDIKWKVKCLQFFFYIFPIWFLILEQSEIQLDSSLSMAQL